MRWLIIWMLIGAILSTATFWLSYTHIHTQQQLSEQQFDQRLGLLFEVLANGSYQGWRNNVCIGYSKCPGWDDMMKNAQRNLQLNTSVGVPPESR